MKKLIVILIFALALQSCENKTQNQTESKNPEKNIQKRDKAEEWLKSNFKCKNGNGYCFYLDKEQQICTKRFYEFMVDSESMFGASNLTEDEYPNALKAYNKKWLSIYPLRNENTGETWLFGRGNDDMENIKKVEIKKISDLKYSIFIDYGEDIKTQSEVTLIVENKDYKIDFCQTEYLN